MVDPTAELGVASKGGAHDGLPAGRR